MKSFILIVALTVMLCAEEAGAQSVIGRARSMARIGIVGHHWGLPRGVSHEGVGYGSTRLQARMNVCQSGALLRRVRVSRGANGFYAVAHSR